MNKNKNKNKPLVTFKKSVTKETNLPFEKRIEQESIPTTIINRKNHDSLILWADNAIQKENSYLLIDKENIKESYNGQIASFGVSIAMIGVRATLAIYYQDKKNKEHPHDAYRLAVLEVIAIMMENLKHRYENIESWTAQGLVEYALSDNCNDQLNILKKDLIDCSIALKQVVRTYNLVK